MVRNILNELTAREVRHLIISALFFVIYALCGTAIILTLLLLTDHHIQGKSISFISVAWVLGGLLVLKTISNAIADMSKHFAGFDLVEHIREKIILKLKMFSLGFYTNERLSEISTVIHKDVDNMEMVVEHLWTRMSADFIVALILGIGLFCMDWLMGVAMISVLPIALFSLYRGIRSGMKAQDESQDNLADMVSLFVEYVKNSNLIFTEVLSHIAREGRTIEPGPNGKDSDPYASLVELYNPMTYPVRLDDYYLVGMSMKGGTMKFVKTPSRNPTDADFDPNLQNAYLIPLKTILWHHKYGNKTQSGSLYEIPRTERKSATFYVPSMGAMKELALSGNGATANYADREYKDFHYLLPGQTLLIGGHLWYSYARNSITTDTWYNNISDKLKEAYSEAGGYQLKGVFYHSKADEKTFSPISPLDLMPGDAVALVRL